MKNKHIQAHMSAAEVYSKLSTAKRLQVGCVIVKNNTIIGIGYNGMPSGWTNDCEYVQWTQDQNDVVDGTWFYCEDKKKWYRSKTKPEVLHAETNALAKVARSTNSSEGAALFVTHAPCMDCAKLIYQSGINSVFYRNTYRTDDGVEFLQKAGVRIEKI